jgi:hypothetical protein
MTTDGRAHAGSQPALAILRHSKGTMYQIPSLWISYYNPTPRIAIDTGICGIKVWKGRPEVSHPLRCSSLDTIPPYRHTAVTPMSATPHPVCSRHTLPRTRRIRGRTLGTDLVFMFGPQMRAAASIAAASSRWPMSVSGNNCQHLQLIALSQRNYLEA